MPKIQSEESIIRSAAQFLDNPDHVGYRLMNYIAEYQLPIKVVAALMGMHPANLYSWTESDNPVRLSDRVEAQVRAMLDKLIALEAQGALPLEGNLKQRSDKLAALLSVETPSE